MFYVYLLTYFLWHTAAVRIISKSKQFENYPGRTTEVCCWVERHSILAGYNDSKPL